MNLLLWLVAVPALTGLATLACRTARLRRGLLLAAAGAHAALTVAAWRQPPAPAWNGWLALDAVGQLFLAITSLLFLAAAVYAGDYLRGQQARHMETEEDEGFLFNPVPEAVFCSCLLFFLSAMTLVILSRHFGLFWVAMEATTLASAPLIFFHRTPRSLEATWKYLLICSVGIALALLGTFFLATASGAPGGGLTLDALVRQGAALDPRWLKAALLFLLVGYGTKMGLAPMHAWLPDAHSESPSVVSALLSGALLNTAWLGILRVHQVCCAAGLEAFSRDLLVFFGLLSLGVAAVFILGQGDFKRLLAYSSVEHMGILALGLGLGGAAIQGSLLHAVGHSLSKAALFLTAGNLLAAYRTKAVADVRGALTRLPVSGSLWLAGLFAITGAPPFVTFLSEFIILRTAVQSARWVVVVLFLLLLAAIFVSMAAIFLRMTLGRAPAAPASAPAAAPAAAPEHRAATLPPLALAGLALLLGVWWPAPLAALLRQAAALLGGGG